MSDLKQSLLMFYNRPLEPCFLRKVTENFRFDLPEHFFTEKFKPLAPTLSDRYGGGTFDKRITVRDFAMPDISFITELPYNDHFSLFLEKHRAIAGRFIDILMQLRDVEDLISICTYCQLRVNPYLFNYCISVAILHRPDTKGLNIPTFFESFPDKFVDPKTFRTARETAGTLPEDLRMPLVLPQNYTASEKEPEQRVAYFREDIGINLHHWHWHLVYPSSGDLSIVNKDRRGELFYYMHQQIIARYNVARLCNNLARVVRYKDFKEPIAEGYFPKLNSTVASRAWPPRFANTIISDIERTQDQAKIDISQMELWRENILEAIRDMAMKMPNGEKVPFDEITGIDVLGNLVEASALSRNPKYYGDLHNMGHVVTSYAHDPDNRHLEKFGVMGDLATTMRDPLFYRWHSYIDDLFDMYKVKLPPYPTNKLEFPGIKVSSISLSSGNKFNTYWEQSTTDLERGMDFTPRGAVLVRFTHLQHEEFEYVIEVNNSSGQAQMGTFRVFISPTVDENGKKLTFADHRRLMLELDKFTRELKPGVNTVRQKSTDSSVTIPFERTFQRQSSRPGESGSAAAAAFDFCGCGWPHYMLIPKGTEAGYPVVLFVMVSDWTQDRVEQDTRGTCSDAASYCGIRDRKFPDKQAMGFPFDRAGAANVTSLDDFLTPNMAVKDCIIQFTDAITQ